MKFRMTYLLCKILNVSCVQSISLDDITALYSSPGHCPKILGIPSCHGLIELTRFVHDYWNTSSVLVSASIRDRVLRATIESARALSSNE